MKRSTIEAFLGGSYTRRHSLLYGLLMTVLGGALLFLRTNIDPPAWALATGTLTVLGGVLLITGPIGGRLGFQSISEHWHLTTGVGSVIVGIAMVLIPVYQPKIIFIVVGLLGGISLVGQGIVTVQARPQTE